LGIIGRISEHLRIAVIANGDLTTPQAVLDCFDQTHCAGAMIGRGAFGNPWIFRETLMAMQGNPCQAPSLEEKKGGHPSSPEYGFGIQGGGPWDEGVFAST